ncbi:MAG: tRNA lysidine(34) synthetase TilS, partial [Sphingobacteriales bacterium]
AGKVLAAVSGGMDSVLMAHLLKVAGYPFAIAHCNFMLRGADADADQQFTQQLAQTLDVPFYTTNFDTGQYAQEQKISIQMAARDLRYQWFEQLRQQHGFDAIALAHHQNDTIETILLNLTRGTGIAGLHGILPQNGYLVRPLLFLNRHEIQTIIATEGLTYVEDASNASTKYARNKLRHKVVPVLKELNPNIEATFENNLRNFREMEILLSEHVEHLANELLIPHDDNISLSIEKVKHLSPKRLLLFKLLQRFDFIETTVDDLLTVLDKHPGRVFASATHLLLVDRQDLIITPKNNTAADDLILDAGDKEGQWNGYRLNILHDDSPLIIKDNPFAVSLDADLLVYPLSVRSWQQGDSFYPLGMK